MKIKNSTTHYGMIAIAFHWIMAILIISMICLGLYMADLPRGMQKLKLYGWHKEFGLLILGLVIIRIIWRYINITPILLMPRWEKITALTVHYLFYVLLIAMPLTGWLMTSAAGLKPSFFGLFVLPALISPDKQLMLFFGTLHQWFAYALIALIVLHVLAAFKHYLIDKDDIMQRMIS